MRLVLLEARHVRESEHVLCAFERLCADEATHVRGVVCQGPREGQLMATVAVVAIPLLRREASLSVSLWRLLVNAAFALASSV